MKVSIVSTLALALTAAAVPHRGHRHRHAKREPVIEYETDVVTATAPVAVVYVNRAGAPQWTSYHNGGYPHGGHQPTSSPATSAAPAPSSAAPAEGDASDSAPAYSPPASAPASGSSPSSESAAPSSPSSASPPSYSEPSGGSEGGSPGMGLSYSPYNSDGSCKTQDQVDSDVSSLSGYGMLRIYGTDCDQATTVIKAAKQNGMKIFAGLYDISNVESEANTLIDAVGSDWSAIDTVSVGNEVVNSGSGSASDVVSAIGTARSLLKSAGYSGPVVTVDTFSAIIDNPELCQASDYAAANCHAFFNSDLTADQAGQYVSEQAENVKQACGGMKTVITESGWPSKGETNGNAVPSEANQKAAIDSLRAAFSSDMILFSAYNDLWKENFDGSFNAEHYWGIYGTAPSA